MNGNKVGYNIFIQQRASYHVYTGVAGLCEVHNRVVMARTSRTQQGRNPDRRRGTLPIVWLLYSYITMAVSMHISVSSDPRTVSILWGKENYAHRVRTLSLRLGDDGLPGWAQYNHSTYGRRSEGRGKGCGDGETVTRMPCFYSAIRLSHSGRLSRGAPQRDRTLPEIRHSM